MSNNNKAFDMLVSVSLGFLIGVLTKRYLIENNSASGSSSSSSSSSSSDDDYQSLYYSVITEEQGKSGIGFPDINTIDENTKRKLLTIQPEYRKLDFELYKQVVENMIITCVDVIIQRKIDNKLLLFYRRDRPAKHIWWWPGGRMFRGETFADAAKRKISDETGMNDSSKIIPIGVIDCWNTFFPDSNWDNNRKSGYEGTQTVNITMFCKYIGDDNMDSKMNEKAHAQFAVDAHKWISVEEGRSNKYDKYVRLNIEKAIEKSFLSSF